MNTTTQKLRLVKGKFMRGKDEVPPEFGNKEQIELIKRSELLFQEYSSEEGHCVEPSIDSYEVVTAEIEFTCICGNTITRTGEDGDEWGNGKSDKAVDDAINSWRKHSCNCGKEYLLEKDSEGDVVIKFKK